MQSRTELLGLHRITLQYLGLCDSPFHLPPVDIFHVCERCTVNSWRLFLPYCSNRSALGYFACERLSPYYHPRFAVLLGAATLSTFVMTQIPGTNICGITPPQRDAPAQLDPELASQVRPALPIPSNSLAAIILQRR